MRGSLGMERVQVPLEAQLVELELNLGADEYSTYQALLHNVEGDEILALSRLESKTTDGQPRVPVTIPSRLHLQGDYYASLRGAPESGELERIDRYVFRVLRADSLRP